MYIVWRKRLIKGTGGGPFLVGPAKERNSDCAYGWRGLRCDHSGTGRTAYTPLVVQSGRIDGQPRQRVFYRFPTIRSCCAVDERQRAAWWHDVDHSMKFWCELGDELAYISGEDLRTIRATLRVVVPRPGAAAAAEFARFAEQATRERDASFRSGYDNFFRNAAQAASDRRNGASAYEILGLVPGATLAEVKAAHRRLAMDHHPDRGGDPERFKLVQAAYETIKRELARAPAG